MAMRRTNLQSPSAPVTSPDESSAGPPAAPTAREGLPPHIHGLMKALAMCRTASRRTTATRVCMQEPTSTWHGPEGKDWVGEGWLAPPKGIAKHTPDLCYLPQKWLHTWGSDGSGHKKGVNAIQWFPRTAHLLGSAGLDGRVKLWDVHGGRKCRRTYEGHSLGVRALTFNADGSRFISTAYDKKMLLWDTETGQVLLRAARAVPLRRAAMRL